MGIKLRNYAYIGDAVWELYVREHTIIKTQNSKDLHKMTTDRVKASFQAGLLQTIEAELNEEETELMRRGRNLSVPIARRSNQSEYRQSTSFEVLIGWWYTHNKERLKYFLNKFEENIK